MDITREYIEEVNAAYEALSHSTNPKAQWKQLKKSLAPWPDKILSACKPPFEPATINDLRGIAKNIGEMLIVDLIDEQEDNALEKIQRIREVVYQLVVYGGEAAKNLAEGLLESMMIGIEALSEQCVQEIIDCLCDIVDLNLGTMPKWRGYRRKHGEPKPKFYDILNGTLYAEIVRFHKMKKGRELQEEHRGIVETVNCPVISVGSRKGGTGKSLFLMATILWIKKRHESAKICILDLDLSGPVWQYLLFPERNKPKHFLDDLIHTEQKPDENFEFPDAANIDILSLVEGADCPFGFGGKLYHLGIRDVPGINRTLALAADLNRKGFYPFLAHIASAISTEYDYLLIDNSPGFDSIPYASLGLACSVPKGLAYIVTTPALPDMAGTFLELSDYRLTKISRPPIWIVNKSTEESRSFLSQKLTSYEVAQMLQAYDGELPEVPVLDKLLDPSQPCDIWQNVAMDNTVSDFLFIDSKGRPKIIDLSKTDYATAVGDIMEVAFRKEGILEEGSP